MACVGHPVGVAEVQPTGWALHTSTQGLLPRARIREIVATNCNSLMLRFHYWQGLESLREAPVSPSLLGVACYWNSMLIGMHDPSLCST